MFTHAAPIVSTLGLISFTASILAEFKKNKRRDVQLDGVFCHVPMSSAMWLGVLALICLSAAQFIGNLIVFRHILFDVKGKRTRTCAPNKFFLVAVVMLSWVGFIMASIMVGAGVSMNSDQAYGKGWLDCECYVVKDGIFLGSALLILVTVSLIVTFIISVTTTTCENEC